MVALKTTKDVIRSSKGAFTFGVNDFSGKYQNIKQSIYDLYWPTFP